MLDRLTVALQSVSVTLWVGGLWVVGFVVAPTLFQMLPERALAGMLAGRLFTLVAYIGFACGGYLLAFRIVRFGAGAFRQGFFWVTLAMLVLLIAGQFGIQPILAALKEKAIPLQVMQSVFRDRFVMWHGVASVLYVIESALGLALVLLQGGARP